MTWPLPQPDEIADRAAGVFEAELPRVYALKNPGAPAAQVDARSPASTTAVFARVTGMTAFDLYLYQARLAQELMPDTAQDWLSRHGTTWGVPRVQATAATGNALAAPGGVPGTQIPAGTQLTVGGATYTTVSGVALDSTGAATVAVQATQPGAAGSLPAGTVLQLVNPIPGLVQQALTVDAQGLTGTDIEDLESWRRRILRRIRQRGASGAASDYEQWVQEVLPGAIVDAISPGPGQVTVVLAMPGTPGPRVPTATELATASAYVSDGSVRRPICAAVQTIAATLHPVDVTLHLNPDTVATRAAATTALQLFFVGDGQIGGTIDVSRLDAAVSAADGEFSHDRIAPAADVTVGPTELPVLGTVTFQ